MPSLDIVNKLDNQALDNAINSAKKEITTRYDFRDSKSSIELDKKNNVIHLLTENEMRVKAIENIIIERLVRQKIDPQCMDFGKEEYAAGNMVKKDIQIREGIDRDTAKKIVKIIKDTRLKVQPQIMEDQVRVTGKKIDDLQAVIATLKNTDLDIPLQFVNFK